MKIKFHKNQKAHLLIISCIKIYQKSYADAVAVLMNPKSEEIKDFIIENIFDYHVIPNKIAKKLDFDTIYYKDDGELVEMNGVFYFNIKIYFAWL